MARDHLATVEEVIEAAGGVIWRASSKQVLEVLLVHRPRYDDWSLPKGKLERGEAPIVGARREVEEETGLICAPGPELPATRHIDRRGRPKRVRYWAMQPVSGEFVPNDEVDEVTWVRVDEVDGILTYERDLAVVAALLDVLAPLR
jgi:8-oxo-dGTP diphosphatase